MIKEDKEERNSLERGKKKHQRSKKNDTTSWLELEKIKRRSERMKKKEKRTKKRRERKHRSYYHNEVKVQFGFAVNARIYNRIYRGDDVYPCESIHIRIEV